MGIMESERTVLSFMRAPFGSGALTERWAEVSILGSNINLEVDGCKREEGKAGVAQPVSPALRR